MISCIVNFKENLTKNIPYYKLLLKQISDAQVSRPAGGIICEHAAINCDKEDNILSKICEGYQFIISFDGYLSNTDSLKKELSALGYRFLSKSDAELVLNAYIHFGEKAPSKLSGAFAFVIYDAMRRQIFAATDTSCAVPLFYTKCQDTYLFASQIQSFLTYPDISFKITSKTLSHLLTFSKKIPQELFENIHLLPPGHILKIKNGEILKKEYSLSSTTPDKKTLEDDFLPQICETLKTMLCEDSAVLTFGGLKDEFLSTLSAKLQSENLTRLYEYSTVSQGASKGYSAVHTQFFYNENSLLDSLKKCVDISAIPTLSHNDFLLPLMFDKLTGRQKPILSSLPDSYASSGLDFENPFTKNIFHPPVYNSLKFEDCDGFFINIPHIIADRYRINLRSPFSSGDISGFSNHSKVSQNDILEKAYLQICENHPKIPVPTPNLLLCLKHILLNIIAEDSAPILAFFDKSMLLSLCERGFETLCSNISEVEFFSYLIKLNLWFLKYKPFII